MLRLSLVVLLLVSTTAVVAEDFDYNYLTFGYGQVDFDNANVDGDGFGIGGSYAINPSYHVFAGYNASDLDFNIDATSWDAGIGYHRGLSDVVDLVAQLSYEYVELDAAGFSSVDDSGLGLGVGLRFAATPQLELDAGIQHVDYGSTDDTAFGLGGLYSFTDYFSLGLGGEWGDDVSAYTLSGRFYFDR